MYSIKSSLKENEMKKKSIAVLLIFVLISLMLSSCVTKPRFTDFIGVEKEEALSDLDSMKSSNTLKLVLNWLLWGWIGIYIPSIVDTINYFDYLDDFNTIERKIEATPAGSRVGQ
jgi:hypothetical protein